MAPRARPPDGTSRLVVTADEVAEALGLHPQTVYRLARQGELPMWKVGRTWFMYKRDLWDKLRESRLDEPPGERGERDA